MPTPSRGRYESSAPTAHSRVDRDAEQIAILAVLQEVAEPERIGGDRRVVDEADEGDLVVVVQVVEAPFGLELLRLPAQGQAELVQIGRRLRRLRRHDRAGGEQVLEGE